MLFRQGDVFIETAPAVPATAIRRLDAVLAEGELTGHEHRIEDAAAAALFDYRGLSFLEVFADQAKLVHDEHDTIVLSRGTYRFWRQREYDARRFATDGAGYRARFVRD
jgi:hypothetical protein